jgi:ketosteroid isomerase-like protein
VRPVEREILEATERRSRALVARDAEALRALHHPRLRWTTHRGDVRDREAYVDGNTNADLVWRAQRLEQPEVVLAGDTAVLTAVVYDEFERAGTPDAHRMRLTLTWVREPAGWVVLAGHAGPVLQP